MFRRPLGRPARRLVTDRVHPALRRANRLMETGQYAAAADVFEQIASASLARNGRRSLWLFFQAGQARLLEGQTDKAIGFIKDGLSLLARNKRYLALTNAGLRFESELKAKGLSKEAEQIGAHLQTLLPPGFREGLPAMEKPTRLLPANCPGCGAALLSNEVEWVDAETAECSYCGSAVRAE